VELLSRPKGLATNLYLRPRLVTHRRLPAWRLMATRISVKAAYDKHFFGARTCAGRIDAGRRLQAGARREVLAASPSARSVSSLDRAALK
jgi:hypothetical protein